MHNIFGISVPQDNLLGQLQFDYFVEIGGIAVFILVSTAEIFCGFRKKCEFENSFGLFLESNNMIVLSYTHVRWIRFERTRRVVLNTNTRLSKPNHVYNVFVFNSKFLARFKKRIELENNCIGLYTCDYVELDMVYVDMWT